MRITNEYDRQYIMAQVDDTSTVILTPPESVATESIAQESVAGECTPSATEFSTLTVPVPGNTYIIKAAASDKILTLTGGNVELSAPGAYKGGSVLWECTESDGWLGFRNPISGRFLGRNGSNILICAAGRQQGWEHFTTQPGPDGSFILKQEHNWSLLHVGRINVHGEQKLAKIMNGEAAPFPLEFHSIKKSQFSH